MVVEVSTFSAASIMRVLDTLSSHEEHPTLKGFRVAVTRPYSILLNVTLTTNLLTTLR